MDKLQGMNVWNAAQLVMLFVFFTTFAYKSIGLRIRRKINPIKFNFRQNRFLGVLEGSLLISVTIWAIEVMFYSIPSKIQIFPWPFNILLINALPAKFGGLFINILAFILFFSGLKKLGDSWRLGIDENLTGELVTNGIYGFTRNPIYMFFNLWFLGTFLMNGTLIFLCFALFTIINLHFQIKREEEFLSKVHESKFVEYCERTPRYFSWKVFIRNRKTKTRISTGSIGK